MSFPISPTNGQLATVNNIEYVYSSATNSWTIVTTSVRETLNKANSAYIQANSAFIHANAAFDKANTGANAEVSTFSTTSNGSVSTFALGFTPASNSAVIVSIGGIVQTEPDDYVVTRTNNSISFNEPPPAGEKIRVAGFNNVIPYFLDVANSAGATVSTYNNIGDGTSTSFNIGFRPESEKTIFVSIGGILQPESAYTVNPSTNTVIFFTAPADGENIRVVGFEKINPYYIQYVSSNVSVSTFETTANGSYTTFNLGFNPQAPEVLLVTIDGVVQPTSSYNVNTSQQTITFDEAPGNGELVRVATFYTTANVFIVEEGSITTSKLAIDVSSKIDGAYNHANAAYDSANTSASTIDGAYNHANAAYDSANTAASTGKAIAMALVFGG